MRIDEAQQVMLRTHLAALKHESRANALLLESPPGIGKSDGTFQACEALAKQINEPVGIVQFMLATISSVDVRGFMLPTKPERAGDPLGTVFSVPPWFPTQANTTVVEPSGAWHGPGRFDGPVPRVGILFLDEFGQAEDEVKKSAAELLYKGAVGTTSLPTGWRVIAAQNRTSDRSGVLRELMFLVNRRCRLSIDASLPAWLKWAERQPDHSRPHYLTLSFAQKNPDIVFRDSVPEGSDPFCTPRTLCLMDRDLQALASEEDIAKHRLPLDDIAREVCAGWIGGGSAGQFYTHIKFSEMLPDIEDVIKAPDKAKLPEGRDVQMICGYMLAHHVADDTAQSIMKYINRLGVEMQVLAVKAASAEASRAKSLVVVPEYTAWLVKNKELLVASQS